MTDTLWLTNDRLRVGIDSYGGRLVSIQMPEHVLLGFDDPASYRHAASFGGLLGRYANRIAGGQFSLDGQAYQLARNEGANTLHGGPLGFSRVEWQLAEQTAERLVLTHLSPDGDQGFPGEVRARAVYHLDGPGLWLELSATTTRPTVLNLSIHPYFNLGGAAALDIADHELTVAAEAYLPTDKTQIPTGESRAVAGTAFDFRSPVLLRERLREADPQLLQAGGLDHCFVLGGATAAPRPVARLRHRPSGRRLDLHTTAPGLQVYTSNKLDGTLAGRGGAYRQSAGLAMEPQGFPDAPNHPQFPTSVLRPGETFRAVSGFVFSS